MRNLIVHPDGRLKTGRLSLMLFVSLLLGLSLIFYLQKPVDKAVVVVRHIFNAPQPQSRPEPEKPEKLAKPEKSVKPVKAEKPQPARAQKTPPPVKSTAKTEKPAVEKARATASKAVVTAKKSPARQAEPAPAPAPPAPPRERVKVVKELPAAAPKTALAESVRPVEKPAPSEPVKMAGKKAEAVKTAVREEPEPVQDELAAGSRALAKTLAALPAAKNEPAGESAKLQPETSIKEELVTDRQQTWTPPAPAPEAEKAVSASTAKPAAGPARLMSANALERLEKRYAETGTTGPAAAAAGKKRVNFKLSAFTRSTVSKSQAKTGTAAGKTVRVSVARKLPSTISKSEPAAAGPPPAITVARQDYYKLNRAWRKAGEGREQNDTIIPLRIENLRSAYRFLQMKPVVIRADGSCIDLNDGRRIPPQSLDRFSATVIEVNDPWEKWGAELHKAGLKPGDKFEVRYYLYDFVRRSVYARVNQAYDWARRQGLIPAATRPAEVDVLGRAYVVKREGGGAFGVFVPLKMTSRDGRTIRIDPVAFNQSPDIAALRRAGVI